MLEYVEYTSLNGGHRVMVQCSSWWWTRWISLGPVLVSSFMVCRRKHFQSTEAVEGETLGQFYGLEDFCAGGWLLSLWYVNNIVHGYRQDAGGWCFVADCWIVNVDFVSLDGKRGCGGNFWVQASTSSNPVDARWNVSSERVSTGCNVYQYSGWW